MQILRHIRGEPVTRSAPEHLSDPRGGALRRRVSRSLSGRSCGRGRCGARSRGPRAAPRSASGGSRPTSPTSSTPFLLASVVDRARGPAPAGRRSGRRVGAFSTGRGGGFFSRRPHRHNIPKVGGAQRCSAQQCRTSERLRALATLAVAHERRHLAISFRARDRPATVRRRVCSSHV